MRCACYARYSSDLQHDRSIDDQISSCRRFAAQRNWVVLDEHVYCDRALSGASMVGRVGAAALVKAASQKPRPFDYVLIEDTSRLSRDMGETNRIISLLRFEGVHVFFVAQQIDTKTKHSSMSVGMHSIIDSQYREDLASKTLRGMCGAVQRGFNPGGKVYGYRYIREFDASGRIDKKTGQVAALGSRIQIDPEESEIVRQIFRLFADGLSTRDITHYLNNNGYPPPRRKRQLLSGRKVATWLPGTVRGILTNEKYIGDWTFNKRQWMRHPETGKKRWVEKDHSEWIPNQRPDLAVIDPTTWEKVQARVVANRKGPPQRGKGNRSSYLLSGLMKCHVCGASYVLVTGNDRHDPAFGCATNKQRGKAVCPNNFKVRKSELEEAILRDIQAKLLSPAVFSAVVNLVNKKLKGKLSELRRRSAAVDKDRQQVTESLGNLVEAIKRGVISTTVTQELEACEHRLRELDEQKRLLDQDYDFDMVKVNEGYVAAWLQRLRELVNTNPLLAKSRLIPLIGEFILSPEMIDGVKYLRVKAQANAGELLVLATGQSCSKSSGGGRIRTSEGFADRFTVCSLWPLGNPTRFGDLAPEFGHPASAGGRPGPRLSPTIISPVKQEINANVRCPAALPPVTQPTTQILAASSLPRLPVSLVTLGKVCLISFLNAAYDDRPEPVTRRLSDSCNTTAPDASSNETVNTTTSATPRLGQDLMVGRVGSSRIRMMGMSFCASSLVVWNC